MSCEEEETFYTEGNESKRTFNTSTSSILNDSKPEFHDSGTTMSDSSNDSSRIEDKPATFTNTSSNSVESFVERKPSDSFEEGQIESIGQTSDDDGAKTTTTILQQPDIIAEAEKKLEPETIGTASIESDKKTCKVEMKRVKTLSYKIKQLVSVVIKLIKIIAIFWFSLFEKSFEFVFNRKKSIRNQVVLVTGSAGYLGRQLACELSKQGVTLILWDINEDENKKTYEALRELGHRRMHLYQVDLSNENDVRENAKKVIEKHGFVSVVVLSAATPCDIIGLFERPTSNILRKNESFSSYQLAEAFKLFYQSNLWLYQEFLPQMKERNTGHFVLVSSESVHLNVPQMSTYSCLKTAQTKLIETFDTELNQNDKLNKIKTSVVYLGPLKGGISNKITNLTDIYDMNAGPFVIEASTAAKNIVDGFLRDRAHMYIPRHVYIVYLLSSLLPKKCFEIIIQGVNLLTQRESSFQSKKVN